MARALDALHDLSSGHRRHGRQGKAVKERHATGEKETVMTFGALGYIPHTVDYRWTRYNAVQVVYCIVHKLTRIILHGSAYDVQKLETDPEWVLRTPYGTGDRENLIQKKLEKCRMVQLDFRPSAAVDTYSGAPQI